MARPKYPSDKQDQFMLRLPAGMRDRIKDVADLNDRSMNAEIAATLEKAYPADAMKIDSAIQVIRNLIDENGPGENDYRVRVISDLIAQRWFEIPENKDEG